MSEVNTTSEPKVEQTVTVLDEGSDSNWKARFAELGLMAVWLVRPASLRFAKQTLGWMEALIELEGEVC